MVSVNDLKIEKDLLDTFLKEYANIDSFNLRARNHIMQQIEWLIVRSQFNNILCEHFEMAFNEAIQAVKNKMAGK
jgi:hypothetical protein